MNPVYLFFFLVTAGINSIAQLLLKRGSQDLGVIFASSESWLVRIFKIFSNPYVMGAALALAGGMIVWLKLISKVELSRAYPANIALTIIITSVASIFLFQEYFTLLKFTGTVLIIAGLWLILLNA